MDRAVFLDRDGVINELVYYTEHGVVDSPFTVQQFKLCPGVPDAVKLLNNKGFKVIVVSNQPGVAKNHFAVETLKLIDAKMKAELSARGAFLDGIYYCLHHPEGENSEYRRHCTCRKPQPGLLLQAAADFDLDMAQCYMVGDNLTDIKAGKSAGCKTILIGTMKCEVCHMMEREGIKPDAIASRLMAAAATILNEEGIYADLH